MSSKNEVEKIIDYFAKDKEAPLYNFTLMCGGYICLQDWLGECPDERAFEEACHIAIPNEVMIGDVLFHTSLKYDEESEIIDDFKANKILYLWAVCGFTKSLNQIAEESGYGLDSEGNNGRLINSNANVLFEFLNTLIK